MAHDEIALEEPGTAVSHACSGVAVLLGSETEPSSAPQPAWGQIGGPQLGTNAPGGQGQSFQNEDPLALENEFKMRPTLPLRTRRLADSGPKSQESHGAYKQQPWWESSSQPRPLLSGWEGAVKIRRGLAAGGLGKSSTAPARARCTDAPHISCPVCPCDRPVSAGVAEPAARQDRVRGPSAVPREKAGGGLPRLLNPKLRTWPPHLDARRSAPRNPFLGKGSRCPCQPGRERRADQPRVLSSRSFRLSKIPCEPAASKPFAREGVPGRRVGSERKAGRAEGQRRPPRDPVALALGAPGRASHVRCRRRPDSRCFARAATRSPVPCFRTRARGAAATVFKNGEFLRAEFPGPDLPQTTAKTENSGMRRGVEGVWLPRAGGGEALRDRFQRNETEAQAGGQVWASVRGNGALPPRPAHPCFPSPNPSPDAPEIQNRREGLRRATQGPLSAQRISVVCIGWKSREKFWSSGLVPNPCPFSAGRWK
uniref:Uncharacterized protein n=1 Tax=Rangifer tarandus platyrhynchus TaxID=3082113 RepID=A0ACB0F0K4_RANTA|nr:unnamed protein product [Rangifer tarandus platyrhynchus]